MTVWAMIFLVFILFVFPVLDIFMLVSLLKPGDERNQIIVWKASSFTLFGMVGSGILDIIIQVIQSQPLAQNPVVSLEVTAVIYFLALIYYKRKHGG